MIVEKARGPPDTWSFIIARKSKGDRKNMAIMQKPFILDETGKDIGESMHKIANHLGLIALSQMKEELEADTNYAEVGRIVAQGLAPGLFGIGDQLNIPWRDGSQEYVIPMDVVHHGLVELEDGEQVPGMILQWHYASPFGVQFDGQEAFYKAKESALPAGTYHVTMGFGWGTNVVNNKVYQFTLEHELPVGGVLTGFTGAPDQNPSAWRVTAWSSNTATEATETVAVTEGDEGTDLGTFTSAGNVQLNSLHKVAYGFNNWKQSGIRQYLNSDAAAGTWWTPQNDYDRAPAELATKDGFMKGFDPGFLDILGVTKVQTARNTVSDDGGWDTTYDKFFLPSLEQMYCNPQIKGEGDFWEFWKRTSGAQEPLAQYGTYPRMIKYALNAKTSAQYVRLRSAYRGHASDTWNVYASGGVINNYASYSYRFAPACVITGHSL